MGQAVARQTIRHVVDKQKKTAVVIDVAIPAASSIRKKDYEKTKNNQSLKEQLEQMCEVRSKVVLW